MRGIKCSWRPAIRSLSQKSILFPILSKILIHELDGGAECIVSKFSNDTKLEGVADTTGGHADVQKNILEEWLAGKFAKFNERENKVLHLRSSNLIHYLILRASMLESS